MRRLAQISVFTVGLGAALWSGIATYRALGLYGGPVASGFHREWDPTAKKYLLVRETTMKSGIRMRRVIADDQHAVLEMTTIGEDGRTGFSSRGDGIIDAWTAGDPKAPDRRVEMSTRRNGKIDRWEQYVKDALVRVDLDTDGNGKPDKWEIYEDGIMIESVVDADEDGKADQGA